MTITFADGGRFVMTRTARRCKIWMAAGTTAWHFDHGEDGQWIARHPGDELMQTVARVVGDKLGTRVAL